MAKETRTKVISLFILLTLIMLVILLSSCTGSTIKIYESGVINTPFQSALRTVCKVKNKNLNGLELWGNGVLVKRIYDRYNQVYVYYILSASHVVFFKKETKIQVPSRIDLFGTKFFYDTYFVKVMKRIEKADLVLLQFTSTIKYPVSKIATIKEVKEIYFGALYSLIPKPITISIMIKKKNCKFIMLTTYYDKKKSTRFGQSGSPIFSPKGKLFGILVHMFKSNNDPEGTAFSNIQSIHKIMKYARRR